MRGSWSHCSELHVVPGTLEVGKHIMPCFPCHPGRGIEHLLSFWSAGQFSKRNKTNKKNNIQLNSILITLRTMFFYLAGQLDTVYQPQRLNARLRLHPETLQQRLSQKLSRTRFFPSGSPSFGLLPCSILVLLVSPSSSTIGSALFVQNKTWKWRPRSNRRRHFSFSLKVSFCRDFS